MAEELGEKTEEPTAHRMNKARDEGQVAWSKDFASFVVLFSGTVALMLLAIFAFPVKVLIKSLASWVIPARGFLNCF